MYLGENGIGQLIKRIKKDIHDVASKIPTSLKNPHSLTFTGGVTGSYDGSSAKTVEIPKASTTTPKAAGTAATGTESNYAKGDHVHPLQTSVSGSSGSCTGNAASATKLATARSIKTNLASSASASFNGTANITPGVQGVLPIGNGGTGASNAASARANLGITPENIGAISNKALTHANFNNLIVPGFYTLTDPDNAPDTSGCYGVLVLKSTPSSSSDYTEQIAISEEYGDVYVRYNDGSWHAWRKLAFE